MLYFIIALLTALVLTGLIIRYEDLHHHLSADHHLDGPQKFHAHPVPRIGGLAVFVAYVAACVWAHVALPDLQREIWCLLLASLPAFLSGLVEDFTKRVSALKRLLFTAVSALIGIVLLGAQLQRADIPGFDFLLQFEPVAVVLTLVLVAGVANSVNIIDGFNGLASMCLTLMMLTLAYVAFQVGDTLVLAMALAVAGALLGFFVWNFPAGLIFLGDGGSYFLGFILGELSLLLLVRNPEVSPLFALLLCAYPIFETLFSMYRRKAVRGVPAMSPDGIHLHTLIHRRMLRMAIDHPDRRHVKTRLNSYTSPYLWILTLLTSVPALLFWHQPLVLAGFIVLFVATYVWLYRCIVRFRTPRWLVIGGQ